MPEAKSTHAAFISHASQDREKALEICESLEARGLKCWIAPRDVRPGRDFPEEIVSGIMNSRCFVLVLSEAANQSPFVKKELERAVSYRKPIFPVRIEEVMPSPALELLVSATQWIDAWSGSLVDHMDQLVAHFHSAESELSLSPPPRTMAARIKRFVRRRTGIAVAAAASLLALLIILLLLIQPGGIGEKYLWPKTLADLRAVDFQVTQFVSGRQSRGKKSYFVGLHLADDTLRTLIHDTRCRFSIDDGPWQEGSRTFSHRFKSEKTPKKMLVMIEGRDGEKAGPLTYQLEFKDPFQGLGLQYASGKTLYKLSHYHGLTLCRVKSQKDLAKPIRRIRVGASPDKLDRVLDVLKPDRTKGMAWARTGPKYVLSFLIPDNSRTLFSQIEYGDSTRGDVEEETIASYGREYLLHFFKARTQGAPVLVGRLISDHALDRTGGEWSIYPMVGDEVQAISWTIYEGGVNPVKRWGGFFTIMSQKGRELGVDMALGGQTPPDLVLTYHYKDGGKQVHRYATDWKQWIKEAQIAALDHKSIIHCIRERPNPDFPPVASCYCRFNLGKQPSPLFKDILWGVDPKDLRSLDRFDPDEIVAGYLAETDALLENRAAAGNKPPGDGGSLSDASGRSRFLNQRESLVRTFKRKTRDWRKLGRSVRTYNILALRRPADYVYFKFIMADGSATSVIRVPVN